jgi:hypothetical protein
MPDPPGKYEEVYAVIRVDVAGPRRRGQSRPRDFLVVKVMRSQELAGQEVERLNAIGRARGHVYFYQVTRLEKNGPSGGEASELPG